MYEIIGPENHEEFEEFVTHSPYGDVLQTYAWSKQKPYWTFRAILVRDESGSICGAMSVLIRKIPGTPYSLMYAARGPACDINNKEVLAEILAGAKELAKKFRCYCLKLDPGVTFKETTFMKNMDDLGFILAPKALNFENIQPQYVMVLDIEGKTEEEVMASFKPKTRYNIRVAKKKNVTVKICGKEAVPDFYKIMVETGERDEFMIRPAQYFADMLDNLGDMCRLYMAYDSEGTPIAGTIAAWTYDKVWYMYGASSNQHRNLMPNYLLQWEMIRWAIENHCRIYDFRGISGDRSEDNHLYGLYRFKSGFNAEFTEFVGEYRYVFRPVAYKVIENAMPAAKKVLKKIRNRGKNKKEQKKQEQGNKEQANKEQAKDSARAES
ncbi:MAG: peptidoglycan bridge formation glycyltransferase FemA/FemB family protein [Lachnospiraceae bacterium]|nr:peptidoglycan bridge formation glycyltransferase FemA/FemB family protein [Lachnospiraceae bacterium]